MAQGEKSAYYQALKREGYEFDRHYREYTTEELKALVVERGLNVEAPAPTETLPPRPDEFRAFQEQLNQLTQVVTSLAKLVTPEQRAAEAAAAPTRRAPEPAPAGGGVKPLSSNLDPTEHAGITLNSHTDQDVLKVDEYGNRWLQLEVPKPAGPKPRGRRVLKYQEPGVVKEQVKVGDYVEEFEVAGDMRNSRPAEIKVTLPSYQTGIYISPQFPFRIHTYQGARGFNLFDVRDYYGGRDLVPSSIKTTYVSNDLCYDIGSTVRAIETEYRERVLRAEKGLTP